MLIVIRVRKEEEGDDEIFDPLTSDHQRRTVLATVERIMLHLLKSHISAKESGMKVDTRTSSLNLSLAGPLIKA